MDISHWRMIFDTVIQLAQFFGIIYLAKLFGCPALQGKEKK